MIRKFFSTLVFKEPSARAFALSFSIGSYIAFSPYIGFHTIMAFVFAWLFSSNVLVVLAASNFINNPWTMIPVYSAGYFVGEWILGNLFGIDTLAINPSWVMGFNKSLNYYLGISGVSWWSFMLGGNLLGLLIAVMLYPVMKRIFTRFMHQRDQKSFQ